MSGFQSELTQQASQIAAKVSRTGGDPRSFGWYLDADAFTLASDSAYVMIVNDEGLTVNGTVNATAGNIGGCQIQNGTLHVANANIDNLNAGKITAGTLDTGRIGSSSITGAKIADYTLASTHMSDGSAVNRVIGNSAVSYTKPAFRVRWTRWAPTPRTLTPCMDISPVPPTSRTARSTAFSCSAGSTSEQRKKP
jgi:hypothetical protein